MLFNDTSRLLKYTRRFTIQIEQASLSLILFNIQFVCSLLIQGGKKEIEPENKKKEQPKLKVPSLVGYKQRQPEKKNKSQK